MCNAWQSQRTPIPNNVVDRMLSNAVAKDILFPDDAIPLLFAGQSGPNAMGFHSDGEVLAREHPVLANRILEMDILRTTEHDILDDEIFAALCRQEGMGALQASGLSFATFLSLGEGSHCGAGILHTSGAFRT